jgi:molybdate transport system substrate-binding protein
MRSARTLAACAIAIALCFSLSPPPAFSAEIKVLTSGGFASTLKKILPQFQKATQIDVTTSLGASQGSSPNTIGAQLRRGAKPDVVIMSREGLNELIAEGRMLPKSDKDLAQTPLGVAVHAGARKPDIGTIAAFKQALLEAKYFNYSSTSGLYLKNEVFPKLGIADQVLGKAIETIITSEDGRRSEMGIQPASEISNVPGIDFVGLVPRDIQFNSIFAAAIVKDTAQGETARQLIEFLKTDAAKAIIKAGGMDPVDQP